MKPTVFVDKLAQDPKSLQEQFSRAFDLISLKDEFSRARAVFIKPNLTYPVYKKGVTTRQIFVKCLVEALREINTSTKIYIGEGEGGYNSFSMSNAMRDMGFYEIEKNSPNVQVVNLSELPTRKIELISEGKPYEISLPAIFFDEIDFSITCPLPKVHCMTKITLSYKNQWGCVPDVMRLKNHHVFNEIIGQICEKLKFNYSFLDGKFGLDNNGPMMGDPIEINWFAASNSLGAMDMIVSEMMGFDWKKINHLKIAHSYGFIPDRNDINLIGDANALKRKFNLKRNFWNYPALIAFHSKHLTHLVYFSRWAKLLHDIMYTFRKRPID